MDSRPDAGEIRHSGLMTVEIDSNSGFCGGVIRAISGAEKILAEKGRLFSLGAIVHNEAELSRLQSKGLITIDSLTASVSANKTLLIRAHGEPPATYRLAKEKGFEVIDFTCPVVLKIQKSIREAYERNAPDGQIVIFGKIGHAEVLGLVGQVDGHAVVVEDIPQLEAAITSGSIDTSRHIDIFSQTTKSPVGYEALCACLASHMASPELLEVHNTICSQVASRHKELAGFARQHDVVIFVSGRESSNGRVLFELCKSVNARTHQVGSIAELKPTWFDDAASVGVCGATSTPKWLLEEVAQGILNLH